MTGATVANPNGSTTSLGANSAKSSSIRDVALASSADTATGRPTEEGHRVGRTQVRADSEVSSLSSVSGTPTGLEEEFQEARDEFDTDLAPPPTFVAGKSGSPAREARFREEI